MRFLTRDIEYTPSADTEFKIVPVGDVHLGHRDCDEAELIRTVQRIQQDPFAYWIGMGDMDDSVGRNVGDKRASESSLAPWLVGRDDILDAQRDRQEELFAPIGPKCLGLIQGNHERSVLNRLGIDMYWRFVEAMSKTQGRRPLALGFNGFIRLRFRPVYSGDNPRAKKNGGLRSYPYTIFCHHGYGGGRKAGGKALKLEDQVNKYEADVYLFGHLHGQQMLRGTRIHMSQQGRMQKRDWLAVLTGTYLQGVTELGQDGDGDEDHRADNYGEVAGYSPNVTGSPEILIRPSDGRIRLCW